MNLQKRIQQFRDLFTNRVWSVDTSEMPSWEKKAVRRMKILRTTLNSFSQNRIGFQCVALSYFVTLAIIPLAAFVFFVTDGLNLNDKIEPLLYSLVPNSPDLIRVIVDKSTEIINTAKNDWVGFISVGTLLWTILWLMFQTERVFNNIWGIRKIPRKIYKRFGFYVLLLFLIPLLVIVFVGGIAMVSNLTSYIGLDFAGLTGLYKFVSWLALTAIATLTLYLMYKFIPAIEVRRLYAFKAALFSAIIFMGFQFLYLKTQIFFTRMDMVYGALAAIPLFLMWLNISWQIIMYGAQLSYSYHHVDRI